MAPGDWIALAALAVAVASTWAKLRKVHTEVRELHVALNSRLDEMLAETRRIAHAAGVVEGRRDEAIEHAQSALRSVQTATAPDEPKGDV